VKKIKKIILSAFGLLMICLTLALVSYNAIGDKANLDSDGGQVASYTPKYFNNYIPYSDLGYTDINGDPAKGGLGIAITTSMTHDANIFTGSGDPGFVDNFSEVPIVGGKRTIYISFYDVVESNSYGIDIGFFLQGLDSSIDCTIIDFVNWLDDEGDDASWEALDGFLSNAVIALGGNGAKYKKYRFKKKYF
jgi:hypothetical protein